MEIVIVRDKRFQKRKSHALWNCFYLLLVIIAIFMSSNVHADFVLGSNKAPVTIIEYGSLTCDYCVKFHREVLPLIKLRHIEKGSVRFIYRHFPTSAAATRGAVAAQCAGTNKYYAMLDTLFHTVGDWSRAKDVDAALVGYASFVGLDEKSFKACLGDPQQTQSVKKEQQLAVDKYDVRGTPTFLINKKIVRGIQDIEEIEVLIREAQSRAN